MSFIAGHLNAGGFMASQRFVSHLTGFATQIGVDLAFGKLDHAFAMAVIPLFFVLGAMISGLAVDRPIYLKSPPKYKWVFGLASSCVFLCFLGGVLGWWGTFGEVFNQTHDFLFLALLCLACGLINAAVATGTGRLVRVTHITGLATDLGVGIVRLLSSSKEDPLRKTELAESLKRLGTLMSFILGSVLGAGLHYSYGYGAFLFPSLLLAFFILPKKASDSLYS